MSREIKQRDEEKELYYLIEGALRDIAIKELNRIVVDLASNQRYFAFLEQLFSVNAGVWLDLEALCDCYEDITKRFQTLQKVEALNAPIDVTWLDYSHYKKGFCLIVFYGEYPLVWGKNVIYNQSHFFKEIAKTDSKL